MGKFYFQMCIRLLYECSLPSLGLPLITSRILSCKVRSDLRFGKCVCHFFLIPSSLPVFFYFDRELASR